MAPSLRIPISAKLDDFEQAMGKAVDVTQKATRKIAQDFISANKEILAHSTLTARGVAAEWAKLGAMRLAPAAIGVGILVGAFKAVSGAIATVKEDLQSMLDIADKSSAAGIGPEFWQNFIAGARTAKVSVEDLEKGLASAGKAVRDELKPDWTVWDTALKKVTDVENKMRDLRELFDTQQTRTIGLAMFRDAQTTEDRMRAIVQFMRELDDIGQHLAMLDLARSAFGPEMADNLRQGKISLQQLADLMQKTASGTHAGELVQRTKEVSEELQRASTHLETSFRPQVDSIAELFNNMKSAWVGIVENIAKANDHLSKTYPAGHQWQNAADSVLSDAAGARDIGGPSKLARDLGAGDIGGTGGGVIPFPRRRPSDAPQPPKASGGGGGGDTADAFDRATEAIHKNIAALHADAAAVGKTAAEHQQFRVELRLLEAAASENENITQDMIANYANFRKTMDAASAMQAAGITLTDEQAESFIKLSNAMVLAAGNADRARTAFQGMNETARFAGNQLIDVIDRATQKGAKFGDIMADVLRSVSRELLRTAITGEGAFAKILGMSSGVPGGTGGIMGALVGALTGGGGAAGGLYGSTNAAVVKMAEGGTIPPGGLAYVGEHGPNPRMIRAGNEPIMVTPNSVATSGGGGSIGGSRTVINIEGSADRSTIAAMQTMLAARDRRFIADVASATRELRRRSVRA